MKHTLSPQPFKPFTLQGETSYPYLSGYTWAFFSKWKMLGTDYGSGPVRFNPENVQEGDTIFIDYNCLQDFGLRILPKIQTKIILITANYGYGADHPMPGPYDWILNDSKIIAWFVQNIDRAPSQKLIPIPIGIANKYWDHGDTDLLSTYIALSLSKKEKSTFCYVNYTLLPNRIECTKHFHKMGFSLTEPKSFGGYLQDLSDSIFVVSPPGNGLDCHRTWEALLMGCYPIVLSTTLNPLYEKLPVVIVEDWNEVTHPFLKKKYHTLKDLSWNRNLLYAPHWFEKVNFILSS